MAYFVGIDIGSTCSKTAILDQDGKICRVSVMPTGWSSVETARQIKKELEEQGIAPEEMTVVSTGYGRGSVSYADKAVTEITCHARGAAFLEREKQLVIIDIGGQDTKLIRLENGQVVDFMMNDKCSAGTGRFLEVMANSLAVDIEELCRLARQGGGISISAMCTVFAESEVISLMGKGESKENIAYGIIDSIVQRVAGQAQRWDLRDSTIVLTGGLYRFDYIREKLAEKLKRPVTTNRYGHYAGAIGAALTARSLQEKTEGVQ